jgi:hypothetical protein
MKRDRRADHHRAAPRLERSQSHDPLDGGCEEPRGVTADFQGAGCPTRIANGRSKKRVDVMDVDKRAISFTFRTHFRQGDEVEAAHYLTCSFLVASVWGMHPSRSTRTPAVLSSEQAHCC